MFTHVKIKGDKPRFCEKCGKALVERDNRQIKYDKYTGESKKVGSVVLKCPDWGNGFGRIGHTYEYWSEEREAAKTWKVWDQDESNRTTIDSSSPWRVRYDEREG